MSNYGVKGWRSKFYVQANSDKKAEAFACLQQGDKRAALELFAKHLDNYAEDFDALHMAGVLLAELGKPERGLAFLDLARKQGSSAYFLNNCGNVLVQLGRLPEADAAFQQALELDPQYAEALLNRGNLYLHTKKPSQALALYEQALSLRSDFADAFANRGIALHAMGQMERAVESFEQATKRNNTNAMYFCAYADLRMALGQLDAAQELIDRAIQLAPRSSLVQLSLGKLNAKKGDFYAAAALFAAASKADPLDPQIYKSGAVAYYQLGDAAKAQQLLREALNLEQEDAELWWLDSLVYIPPVVESAEEAQAVRSRLLKRWSRFAKLDSRFKLPAESIGNIGPAYLMYHGVEDKALCEQYGRLCTALLTEKYRALLPLHLPARAARQENADKRIRICVVIGDIEADALCKSALVGLYRRLDPKSFELHTISLSASGGAEADLARAHSVSYEELSGAFDDAVIEKILQTSADILLYPEIGKHAQTMRMAALRLCPRQIAMWGNPQTTGLPHMDYFLSVQEIEAADAAQMYTEKLVKLPLAEVYCASQKIENEDVDWCTLGLDASKKIVLCAGGAIFYQYKFMDFFAQAWAAVAGAQFVFLEQKNQISVDLKNKLEALAVANPNGNSLLFMPEMSVTKSKALMRHASVMLEGLNFSDFNAALQAIECELPIVSVRSDLLRENFGAGLMATIGLADYTAQNVAEAMALLLRLLGDEASQSAVKEKMRAAKPMLFDRLGPMPVFENFLASLVKA